MVVRGGLGHYRVMDPITPTVIDAASDHDSEQGRKRSIVPVVMALAALSAIAAVVLVGGDIAPTWTVLWETVADPAAFRAWVEGLGGWGPIAFLLAQAAQVVVVPVPGALFAPVGAVAFGAWPALGLSLAGMVLGSAAVFLAARRWGRPLAVRLVGPDRIHRYGQLMTARGGLLVWLVFLLPLLPDDAMCALAGLSGLGFRRFILIAAVGRVPGVVAGVFTTSALEGAPGWMWAIAASAFVGILWAGMRFGPALEQRLLRSHKGPWPPMSWKGARL